MAAEERQSTHAAGVSHEGHGRPPAVLLGARLHRRLQLVQIAKPVVNGPPPNGVFHLQVLSPPSRTAACGVQLPACPSRQFLRSVCQLLFVAAAIARFEELAGQLRFLPHRGVEQQRLGKAPWSPARRCPGLFQIGRRHVGIALNTLQPATKGRRRKTPPRRRQKEHWPVRRVWRARIPWGIAGLFGGISRAVPP
jgi:hypothetical protein